MSSFNLIDYVPATASHWMMTDVLRKQWNFQGFVVTDYGSIGEILQHGTARDLKEASEQSLLAGTDMDMCSQGFVRFLEQSVKEGKVSEADIDIACRRILEAKYKLGLFEDPYRYCDSKRHKTDIFTAAHRQTARDIAAETFVLLKNDRQLLPLSKQGKIALIGPLADTRSNMSGTWSVAATPTAIPLCVRAWRKPSMARRRCSMHRAATWCTTNRSRRTVSWARPSPEATMRRWRQKPLRLHARLTSSCALWVRLPI